ncbi:FecR family protein [Pedobacter rhizosphaerae]|uniref:FecR family protein n=2 Tax=Pedobacter rhizosphaerae TaxID=390241 RepID=A0A1H9VR98_9SPHI|nr:FecR family protein [Pedobacter rhizosphaerae]
MKIVYTIIHSNQIMTSEEFVRLITAEFLEEISQADREKLDSLLSQDPQLLQEYHSIRSYLLSAQIEEQENIALYRKIQSKIATIEQGYQMEKKRKFNWLLRIAALILITLGTSYFLWNEYRPVVASNPLVYSTAKGIKKSLLLSDGTRVILNVDSKIKLANTFGPNHREIYLSGEGYFNVHHDSAHPFLIHTDKADIKVLGTVFNLKAYPRDKVSETTLITGKVQVTLPDRPNDVITLNPSEKLIVRYQDQVSGKVQKSYSSLPELTYLNKEDTAVVEALWRYHTIVFRGKTFGDLSKEMERVYDVSFEFRSAKARDASFSGTFDQKEIRDVLDALALIEPFSYSMDNKKITIY